MARVTVGPFNRVEGDLEVQLDIDAGQVRSAWVNSPLYRGFEQILCGRHPEDALTIAPRVCGICSVSHSIAASRALAALCDVTPPPNGQRIANLVHACENLVDHLTHFYLFFMPDFARAAYADRPWHAAVAERFDARNGQARPRALAARAEFMHLMGLLAGKWPHTLATQPGGTTRNVTAAERVRLISILRGFRRFLENDYLGMPLEDLAALPNMEVLWAWVDSVPAGHSDFRVFLEAARDCELGGLGRTRLPLMAYGSYPLEHGRLFPEGLWQGGLHPLDSTVITEDLTSSWMRGPEQALHPEAGVTAPDDRVPGYTWCKAPRWNDEVVEVGALARQAVDGHPLLRDAVGDGGGDCLSRVLARAVELARVLPAMEQWARELRPGEPCATGVSYPDSGRAAGLTEAARGSLGHWLEVREGRIHNYQIVAPTTWNFSPRDAHGVPGPLEQALAGTPATTGEATPVAVQHVVRSFDPCMVCTVH